MMPGIVFWKQNCDRGRIASPEVPCGAGRGYNIVKGTVLLMGRANPTFQKRQKEVKRLEKNQAKREAREARKNMTPEELAAKRLEEEQNNMQVLNHPDNLPETDEE
jgi:hypothetical protein